MSTCRRARQQERGHDDRDLAVYLVLLFALVHFGIVSLQPVLEVVALHRAAAAQYRLFIPMGWGAPQGPALVVRNAVSIVPDVAGEVTDVPVSANAPLKAGDVLFTIDPDALSRRRSRRSRLS